MTYEALSRALAYVSCLTSMTLFATSMAIAAVNVGSLSPPGACGSNVCTALVVQTEDLSPVSANGSHIEAVATALWQKKI
ncbi:MAG: hypothetical protein AB7S74_06035 [Hyphomicrobium sp.]